MSSPPPERPRRRWRLSLRSLMILVLVCGGWLGWRLDQARRQREAVEALRALGALVAFDDQQINFGVQIVARPQPPGLAARLRRWAGGEYFREVAAISLRRRAGDRELALVARCGGLRSLQLNYRQGDGDLAALAGLGRLESLDIRGHGLDDRTVAPLGRLTSLKDLRIQTTRLTDAGLAPLRSLARLETLQVEYSPDVRSPGVVELLGALPRLTTLSLRWTAVDDAAIPAIVRLPGLREVHLPEGGLIGRCKALLDSRPGLTVY